MTRKRKQAENEPLMKTAEPEETVPPYAPDYVAVAVEPVVTQRIKLCVNLTLHGQMDVTHPHGAIINPAAVGLDEATVQWLLDNDLAEKA